MVGTTNVGGGGSGFSGPAFAYIKVFYPEGSLCTATSGTKSITATDISGTFIFPIPEPSSLPETWTLNCTDGSQQAVPLTVDIESKYQVSSIQLKYGVPSTYYECNYLTTNYSDNFTDGAYIDTGMSKLNWDEQISLEYDINSAYGSAGCIFGYSIGQGIRFGILQGSFYLNGTAQSTPVVHATTSGIEKLIVNDEHHQITYQVGSNISTVANLTNPIETSTVTSVNNIELFGVKWGTAGSHHYVASGVKIYSYKRSNLTTGELIQDFVPCYRKSDLVVGFYDLVSSEFHQAVDGATSSGYTQRINSYPTPSY